MKRRLKLILVSTMILSMLPTQVFAESVNVGVEITNIPTIDVVTTISSNVIVDIQNGISYPTYLDIHNKSTVPIDVYVTDIEALDTDIPSTFLDYNSEEALSLQNATVEDTKSKISFGIEKSYNNYISVQPDTSTLLGTIQSYPYGMGATRDAYNYGDITYEYNFSEAEVSINTYPLKVKTGYAWDESKVLNYSITMVVGLAENDVVSQTYSEYLGTNINVNTYLSEDSTKAIVKVLYQDTETSANYNVTPYSLQSSGGLVKLTEIERGGEVIDSTTNYTYVYYYIDFETSKTDYYLPLVISVTDSAGTSPELINRVIHIKDGKAI